MSLTRNLGNLSNVLTQSGSYALQQTPPQFDNTTKLATTGFVQQALGTLSNAALLVNSNVTLTAAQSGTVLEVTTNSTITLPSPVLGLTYIFAQNGSSGYTVAAGASGSIFFNGGTGVASLTVPGGGALLIWSDGSNWFVTEFSGFGTTPAQFDNSTKLATTAFAKSAGFRHAASVSITSATPLDVTYAGKLIVAGGAGGYVITLPSRSTYPDAESITIICTASSPITIQRAGADLIYPNNASITSFSMSNGDTAVIESSAAVSAWALIGGSAQLGSAGVFGNSLSGAGYQKLPSGLIIQWGSTGTVTSGSSAATNFPISFPTSVAQVVLTAQSSANSSTPIAGGWQALSNSQFTARNLSASNAQFTFFATGY